jgi:hypothetical protein
LTLSLSDNNIEEIPPKPYDPVWDMLLDFRLMRFTFYQYKLREKMHFLKSIVLKEQYNMNIRVKDLEGEIETDMRVADYVVKNIASIAKEKKIKLIFAMNGDTQSIYNQNTGKDINDVLRLNEAMKKVVEKNGEKFIDLHKTFLDDYQINK